MGKRGQVTIFIILGILVVVGISAVVVLSGDIPKVLDGFGKKSSPQDIISTCIEDVLENNTQEILKNGGKLNPNLYVEYKGQNHTYLCYTDIPFQGCINYYPLLKEQIAKEIADSSYDEINSCFDKLINEYEKQGYDIYQEDLKHEIKIVEDNIYSRINKKIIFTKGENKEVFENFNTAFSTKASQLIDIAHRIINEEAESCYFDEVSYMRTYPKYAIYKTNYGYEQSTIYQLKYRETEEEFNFAVRSCVLL